MFRSKPRAMVENPLFIVNPAAAHGRVGRRRSEIEKVVQDRFPDARIVYTEGPGHAVELARTSVDHAVVVAAGGDGTVHEVATGLLDGPGTGALAILGVGTGNDLARALGVPRGFAAGLEALDRSRHGMMDYLRVELDSGRTSIPVFNNVGAGFDAYASERAIRWKRLPGSLGYTAGILDALVSWKSPGVRVTVDDREISVPLMFVTVGNGHSSGGGYLITPDASPFDGRLDVCVVRRLGILRSIRMMPATRSGTHVTAREATMASGVRVEVHAEAPVPVHGDGESLATGCRHLRIDLVPRGLRVFAPVVGGHQPGDAVYLGP